MRMKYFSCLLTVLISTTALAGGGFDGTGNGGTPVLLRAKHIKEYLNTRTRSDLISYLEHLPLHQIHNPTVRASLKTMMDLGLISDIRSSAYLLQYSCKAVGGQDAAGAYNGNLGGDICISPRALAELNSSKAEVAGLLIHEHAHHFGYEDQDYSIYDAVYRSVRFENPLWGDENSGQNDAYPSWPIGSKYETPAGATFERVA